MSSSSSSSSSVCAECGGGFCWDADAQAAVCLGCGLLEDATQLLLDSHIDPVDDGRQRDGFTNTLHTRPALKSFRTRNGWDLAGQGKAATIERNKNAIAHFIYTLASRLGHPGLASRTQLLFEQALERGFVRWGRKARLVSGAALAVALREGKKGETMNDIAFLLEESPVSVARIFTKLVALLEIKHLTATDPSWHLPSLRNRLLELLKDETRPRPLPQSLLKLLKQLNVPSLLRTASTLSDLISRAETTAALPSPPTACALFIVAIEAELLASVPGCELLAKTFAARYGVSGEVVMRRYRLISDEVLAWQKDVPWLRADAERVDAGEAHSASASSSSSKRSKVARRTLIARSLKDVVQYKKGQWKAAFESLGPVRDLQQQQQEDAERSVSTASEVESSDDDGIDARRDDNDNDALPERERKRRKTRHMDGLAEFLLAPLRTSSSLPSRSSSIAATAASSSPTNAALPSLDAVSHLLTGDACHFSKPPTRLQVLALSRPADEIADDELFEDGELDALMRPPEEREALARMYGWTEGEESGRIEAENANRRKNNRKLNGDDPQRDDIGTSRINIEALNRLLDDADNLGEDVEAWYAYDDVGDGDGDKWEANVAGVTVNEAAHCIVDDVDGSEGEIEPWKPLSPGRGADWEQGERFQTSLDEEG